MRFLFTSFTSSLFVKGSYIGYGSYHMQIVSKLAMIRILPQVCEPRIGEFNLREG